MAIRAIWEIDIFPKENLPKEVQNLSEEKQALEYAKHIQERYFKENKNLWTFTIYINGNSYIVDCETEIVTLQTG